MVNEPVNMPELVRSLPSRPRGRACIVLTHEYGGQREWAAELSRQTDSEHIDLLELFAEDQELTKEIGNFSAAALFDFLKEQSLKPVLIVSGIEFLKATWLAQANALNDFARKIQTWNKGPALLVVMQYDKVMATYDFGHRHQYQYVVDQKNTLAL